MDFSYVETPTAWLSEPEPAAEQAAPAAPKPAEIAPPPPPAAGGPRESWPTDLAAFRTWWLNEPALDAGGISRRIAPRGAAGAGVMMLVEMPETDDRDELLSGPQGRLLASFASAAGLPPDTLYLASAMPRHTALPDWNRLAREGHGEVLRHHIQLADPARLIVFGRNILSLLGHDPAQAAPAVSEITIQQRSVPLLASYAAGRLLEHPRLRSGLWQQWLDWTDGE